MSEHRWDFVRHRQSLVDQCSTTDSILGLVAVSYL